MGTPDDFDAFRSTLLLMMVFRGTSGPESMAVWEWTREETDTPESLERAAHELADEVQAFLDSAAEHAPATERVAVQVVRMRGEKTLWQKTVRGTFQDWPELELREVLHTFVPQPYAPRTLIKIVTEAMLRENPGIYLDFSDEEQETQLNLAERAEPEAAWAWMQAERRRECTIAEVKHTLLEACAKERLDTGRALNLFDALTSAEERERPKTG